MRPVFLLSLLLSFLLTTMVGRAESLPPSPGLQTISLHVLHRAAPLTVTLWYPADSGGTRRVVGSNGLFEGSTARQDAPIAPGAHPLVLVSHGGVRSAPGLAAWLDRALALRGYVVADVDAPRLAADAARDGPQELWRRPADVSAALDALLTRADLMPYIDGARIAAVGSALGGAAVLQLAGARIDPESFAALCDAGASGPDCGWYGALGINLHGIDTSRIAGDHSDPRIKAAIALAPQFLKTLSADSLSGLTAQARVLRLGPPSGPVPDLGAIGVEDLADTTAYSAFPVCRKGGADLLRRTGGTVALCDSVAGIDRGAQHARIVDIVARTLTSAFRQTR